MKKLLVFLVVCFASFSLFAGEYRLVVCTNKRTFVSQVEKYLNKGWECQGGCIYSPEQGWIQAMILY